MQETSSVKEIIFQSDNSQKQQMFSNQIKEEQNDFQLEQLYVPQSQEIKPQLKDLYYQFPKKLLQVENIQDKNHFEKLLQQEGSQQPEKSQGWEIRITKSANGSYIYVNCTLCNAKLVYTQNQDKSWKLKKFDNSHNHSQIKKNNKVLTQNSVFKNLTLDRDDLYKKNSNSHSMHKEQLLKVKSGILKCQNFNAVKQLLKQLQYEFKCDYNIKDIHRQSYPQTLVAVSFQQKNNYRKYGQIISYDITYNCIKQQGFTGKKYGVGIFSGFDNNNRMLIFGFSLTTYQTSLHFQNIFSWFFDLMGFTNTTAVITDQQKSLISALQQLKLKGKYNYHHIFDNWHFIKSFGHSIKDSYKKDNRGLTKQKQKQKRYMIQNKISRLIKQSDPIIGNIYLKELKSILEQYGFDNYYIRFQEKLQNICLWAIPEQFVGLNLHSNQKLNDLLKLKLQNETTIYKFIENFDILSKQRIRRSLTTSYYEPYPFQLLYDDKKIEEVRMKFEKKVFNSFIYYYQKAGYFKIIDNQGTNQQISLLNTFKLQHRIDEDVYQIQNLRKCSCKLLQKKGIPCQHIIYLWKQKFPSEGYISLFRERWFPHEKIAKQKYQDLSKQQKNEKNAKIIKNTKQQKHLRRRRKK